jgi:divalent metal cation (Fe/Co/Zn/Cd) transporter
MIAFLNLIFDLPSSTTLFANLAVYSTGLIAELFPWVAAITGMVIVAYVLKSVVMRTPLKAVKTITGGGRKGGRRRR